jgi:DNA-binding transcriptional LysR family regulator
MTLTNLDLDTLRTLVIAYDLGGYGRAAERLGRTPSAISLQMKRLQQDVGVILFRKAGRNLALTEIGEMVLRYGRRILELNDEMLDTVRGASLAGTVRLGFAQDFAETVLPQALSRFTELYPLMQIDARIDRNAALVNAIENGQLDLALALGYSDRPTAHQLGELPMVWIAGDKFTRRKEQALPLVMCEAPCLFWQRALEVLDQARIAWRIALISPSLAGLWAAARAGLGLTVRGDVGLPLSLVASATLFDLPKLGSLPVTLHRTSARKPAAVERLFEIVQEVATRTFAG